MNIQALPEELLTAILDHLPTLPKFRRSALVTLSVVNKLFHRLAQEKILLQPVVHVLNTHGLVRKYLEYPHLAVKAMSLELLTHVRKGFESDHDPTLWHERTASCFTPALDDDFKLACEGIIHGTTISAKSKALWIIDLQHGHQSALTCILLAMLPKLKILYLGTGSLNHFPFLKAVLNPDWIPACDISHVRMSKDLGFPPWNTAYPCEVFQMIAPRLEALELPLNWEDKLKDLRICTGLRSCTSLKHLSLSHGALLGYLAYQQDPMTSFPLMPECLETLVLMKVGTYGRHADDLHRVLSILEKDCSTLPKVTCFHPFRMNRVSRGMRTASHCGKDIEITRVVHPPWRLYAAKLNLHMDFYSDPSWNSQQARNDMVVYGCRQCYPELAWLLEFGHRGKHKEFRDWRKTIEKSIKSVAEEQ